MQLRPRHLFHLLSPESFSILGRIGGDATGDGVSVTVDVEALSVSSVGSEAMQPRLPALHPSAAPAFQYPRSDRRRCNLGGVKWTLSSVGPLSVSSVGSEAMQRTAGRGKRRAGRTFSILGRIGGDATCERCGHPSDPATFQYPRSDRRRCN